MRVAIDVSPLESGHKVRGIGFYVKMLSENIEKYAPVHEYIFFSGTLDKDADIIHYPYFDPFFVSFPKKNSVPTVITVHDLTPIKFPKHFPAGMKGKIKWMMNKHILRNADAIITDSEASKKDVVSMCNISQNKVTSVYLASQQEYTRMQNLELGSENVREKYNLPDDFFLYVGDATWNKNLPRIFEAIQRADQTLVIVGKALAQENVDSANVWNKDLVHVQKIIHEDKRFRVLGFVPNDDLSALYSMATGLVMPSLYEGFGLPVLEAMQSGCPVITSKEGSLPEVAGEAVLYVDAYDEKSIHDGIQKLAQDKQLQKELSEKGIEQAKKFSIEKMIRETVEVYEKFLGRRS